MPLLEIINELGGQAKPKEVYEKIGLRFELTPEEASQKDPDGKFVLFHRSVRWAKEKLKSLGYLKSPEYNVWELTEKGKDHLINCKPNVVMQVFWTTNGDAFWAEFQTIGKHIKDETVTLHLTSPPYPLLKQKEYGNVSAQRYIDWFMPLAEVAYRTLMPEGSFVINLGEVFNPGEPTVNSYLERLVVAMEDRLGFKFCGRFYWLNRSKLPVPAEWVTIRRQRVKGVIEPLYWFSKTAYPKADNRNVLVPYSESQKKIIQKGVWNAQNRPSGHNLTGNFTVDNGGAIPGNLLDFPNTSSNDRYLRACKALDLKPHPARFPVELAKWVINFLTQKGDLVADLCGGSGTVAQAAEELHRAWLIVDKSLYYLKTAALRFNNPFINEELFEKAFSKTKVASLFE